MKIVVGIGHPAHVHFYKNAITELEQKGHNVRIIAKNRRMALQLLESYQLDYDIAGKNKIQQGSHLWMIRSFLDYEYTILQEVRNSRPDVVTGVANVPLSHASSLFNCRSIIFTDSEAAPLQNRIMVPFADEICTPKGYRREYGTKHNRYDGYHELAYLHPDRFTPDTNALRSSGIDINDRYFVLRFISWKAQHDIGHHGLSLNEKRHLVSLLSDKGSVYITSESPLPEEFKQYHIPVPPHLMHDLLAEADLYVGDSQTMATEAAVLGTPAIRSNSFAGQDDMSNFVELEKKYNLLYSTPNGGDAIMKAEEFSKTNDLQSKWNQRRAQLLDDKIDVTEFIVKTILGKNI